MSNPVTEAETRRRLLQALQEYLPVAPATENQLQAAVREAVGHPGGLVRPHLAWETGRAVGLAEPEALRLACALEYFHTASLLLDDLPCMDNARERRGRPCTHRVHGEATAILAALALINRAHLLVGVVLASWPAERRVVGQLLVDACLGARGLLDGQARDLGFAREPRTAAAVARIARQKTAALFQLALQLPALGGAVTPGEWSGLGRLSLYWGLAYQVADDLADVLASAAETGKTGGQDARQQRPNLALQLGIPAARRRLQRLVRQGAATRAHLQAIDSRWNFLAVYQERLAAHAGPLAVAA
jgi:geranylgeranyl diphosphate synthase type II